MSGGNPSKVLPLSQVYRPKDYSSSYPLSYRCRLASSSGPMGVVKNFHGVDSTCSQIACPRRSTIVVHHLPCQANLPIGQQQFVIEYSTTCVLGLSPRATAVMRYAMLGRRFSARLLEPLVIRPVFPPLLS